LHEHPYPSLSQAVLLLIAAMGLTYASFIYQRPGQWLNLDGEVCQQGQQGLCYIPTRNAGFPLAYVVNRVAIAGYSGPGSDFDFVLGSFVMDIVFYCAVLWGGSLIVRNSMRNNYP
jgi:hypothetical protein